jgi:hypothetical protein
MLNLLRNTFIVILILILAKSIVYLDFSEVKRVMRGIVFTATLQYIINKRHQNAYALNISALVIYCFFQICGFEGNFKNDKENKIIMMVVLNLSQ